MRRAQLFLLFLILSATIALSQVPDPVPVIEGYVTRTASLANFDVNGFHIVAGKTATFLTQIADKENRTTQDDPYLGQSVTVYGELKKNSREVIAERVIFHSANRQTLSGFAVVDSILSPAKPANNPIKLLMRADGYLILVNAATKISFQTPLASVSNIATNVWVSYHGKPQA
jgi:hypothetical protein